MQSNLKDKERKSLFESGGEGTLKPSVKNTTEEKSVEKKLKNYLSLEWSFSYVEEDGTLLLIFAKTKGKRKLELSKTFTYGEVRNSEYEDIDSTNIYIDVES